MAIGPNQLTDNFLKEVEQFEKTIDSYLGRLTVGPQSSVTVPVPSRLMTRKHFDILVERYLAAGWTEVQLHYDQREGEWLEFSNRVSNQEK